MIKLILILFFVSSLANQPDSTEQNPHHQTEVMPQNPNPQKTSVPAKIYKILSTSRNIGPVDVCFLSFKMEAAMLASNITYMLYTAWFAPEIWKNTEKLCDLLHIFRLNSCLLLYPISWVYNRRVTFYTPFSICLLMLYSRYLLYLDQQAYHNQLRKCNSCSLSTEVRESDRFLNAFLFIMGL